MVGWTEGRKERGTEERRKIGGREGGRSGMVGGRVRGRGRVRVGISDLPISWIKYRLEATATRYLKRW